MFLPLSHPPGHAQCDYGEARVIIGGVERKAHYFALDLPHSDGCYVKAYPAEATESFCDGHVSAFAFLGGVPQSILYDNTTLAVARILGDGRRQRTRVFSELQSHYLFEDRFGRPGKGNDKGKVEGLVGYVRRNFLVPIPSFESFDALNAHLEQHCLRRFEDRLRGHNETIGERLERDLEKLLPLPAVPYDASDEHATRVVLCPWSDTGPMTIRSRWPTVIGTFWADMTRLFSAVPAPEKKTRIRRRRWVGHLYLIWREADRAQRSNSSTRVIRDVNRPTWVGC